MEEHMPAHEDVFAGSWKANLDKSQPDPNHRFRQATLRLERQPYGYELQAEGIGPDGQPCVDACSIHLDGQEHTHPAAPGLAAIAICRDPHEIEVEARKDGRVVGYAKYAVSADGNTLTAETWGTDAKGRSFKTVVSFDRE